jgi:hypothetical protein
MLPPPAPIVIIVSLGVGICEVAVFLKDSVSGGSSGMYKRCRRFTVRIITDEIIVPARPRRRFCAPVLPQLIESVQRRIDGILHLGFAGGSLRRTYALNSFIEPAPLRCQRIILSHKVNPKYTDRDTWYRIHVAGREVNEPFEAASRWLSKRPELGSPE